MRILVPIDGSKKSEKALDYAMHLQKQFVNEVASNNRDVFKEKEIFILNVTPYFFLPSGFETTMKSVKSKEITTLTDYIKEMNESMGQEWINRFSKIKRKFESSNISIRTEVLIGNSIAESIVKFADKENVDLIVIGNTGLGGISKIKTLGSVSRKVSETSKCPVLITH